MNTNLFKLGALLVLAASLIGCGSGSGPSNGSNNDLNAGRGIVRVNGVQLTQTQLDAYAKQFHTQIPPANYWYDKISGAFGLQGGPTLGFNVPGLDLGGPLQADASRGNTGVFVNGRDLPVKDVEG